MFLSITYQEISKIVKEKAGQDIALAYAGEDTVAASYAARVEIPIVRKTVQKQVNVNLKVLEFKDNRLEVRLDAGFAGNLAIGAVQDWLTARLPLEAAPGAKDGRTFVLDLGGVEQLKPVLEQAEIKGLAIRPDGVGLEVSYPKA